MIIYKFFNKLFIIYCSLSFFYIFCVLKYIYQDFDIYNILNTANLYLKCLLSINSNKQKKNYN